MRILVTGSSKLAGAIADRFKSDTARVEQDIDFRNYDIFINNAHVNFEQVYLFDKCIKAWNRDHSKQIINISSRAGLPNLSKGLVYGAQKAALDHMSDNVVYNSDKICKVTTINLGMLEDELPSLKYSEVCDLIQFIISLPKHLEIPRIHFQHVYNYQHIQLLKKQRYRNA